MTAPTPAAREECICLRNFAMTDDQHAIDCPDSINYAAWKQHCASTVRDSVSELREMLAIAANEEGVTVFDHTPEEIGLHVMENHAAILAALASQQPQVEAMREACYGAVHDAIFPKNPESDWTEYARIRAKACLHALAAIRALPTTPKEGDVM